MIDQYIAQYGRRLYGLCRTLCSDSFDAEDLYQETWLKVCRKIESYDASRPFEAWLTGICVNTYRDAYRRRRRSPLQEHFAGEEEKERAMESVPAEKQADYREVREAVDRLPNKLRVTVILYFFHGFSEKETAAALHIPPGTVKSRLSRAKSLLKEELKYWREREKIVSSPYRARYLRC